MHEDKQRIEIYGREQHLSSAAIPFAEILLPEQVKLDIVHDFIHPLSEIYPHRSVKFHLDVAEMHSQMLLDQIFLIHFRGLRRKQR